MKKAIKDLETKTAKELSQAVKQAREELDRLTLTAKSNPGKDTNIIAKKKKELARMLTILTEKK